MSGCQFVTPGRFPFIWGMVFALNLMILRGIGLIIGNYRSWYCHFFIDPIVVQLTSTGGNQTVDVMQLEAEMVALYLHKVGLILHNQYYQLFFYQTSEWNRQNGIVYWPNVQKNKLKIWERSETHGITIIKVGMHSSKE